MACLAWKQWKPVDPNSKLQYESRIRHIGSRRSFLVFFGENARSDPVVFPVGTVTEGFSLEVIVSIFDGLGDYYQLIRTVKVCLFVCFSLNHINVPV